MQHRHVLLPTHLAGWHLTLPQVNYRAVCVRGGIAGTWICPWMETAERGLGENSFGIPDFASYVAAEKRSFLLFVKWENNCTHLIGLLWGLMRQCLGSSGSVISTHTPAMDIISNHDNWSESLAVNRDRAKSCCTEAPPSGLSVTEFSPIL